MHPACTKDRKKKHKMEALENSPQAMENTPRDIMENPIPEVPGLGSEKTVEEGTTAVEETVVVGSDTTPNPSHGSSQQLMDAIPMEDNPIGIQNPRPDSSYVSEFLNPGNKRSRGLLEMSECPQQYTDRESAKVPKLATEDGTEESKHPDTVAHQRHPKRRKIAIFVAYCGVGYQGMQRNPGAKTIEGDLEEALFKAGAISEDQYGDPRRVDWMRSARTDKGVSAVGQVVSGRFFIDPPGLVERVNAHLPEQIRVLGYKRVTATFSAKKFCDRRRYEYVLPVFALDPTAHRDRESVLASEGKDGALAKCLECSERGRKVAGVMGKRNDNVRVMMNAEMESVNKEFNEEVSGTGNGSLDNVKNMEKLEDNENLDRIGGLNKLESCENLKEAEKVENGEGPKSGIVASDADVEESPSAVSNNVEKALSSDEIEVSVQREGCESKIISVEKCDGTAVKSTFHYGEKERNRFNSILNQFVGTHNFHNLTTRIKAEDPAANRYILSFEASDAFTIDGMDFVRCTVVGQSFMLHQIRKMIGLAVAVMRDCAPESMITTALRKDINMNVPTAPELGLFLDESLFPAYNQKWQSTHEEVSLKGFEQQISEFKQKYIYAHIASTEVKEGIVALWLHSLNHRNYPDFTVASEAENLENGTKTQNACKEVS